MVTMNFSATDKANVPHLIEVLGKRRRQLSDFPELTPEAVHELYMPPEILSAQRTLQDHGINLNEWFYTSNCVAVKVPYVTSLGTVSVYIRANNTRLPSIASHNSSYPIQMHASAWPEFHAWVRRAYKIHVVNKHVGKLVSAVLPEVTTWNQFYKILPETTMALGAQADLWRRHKWDSRGGYEKIGIVARELADKPTPRARQLSDDLRERVAKYRPLVETSMAQAMLLDNLEGMPNTDWQNTWVE